MSLAEIFQKAIMNTILGMGTVFTVLVVISLLISCFKIIPILQAKFSKKKEAPAVPVAPYFPAVTPEAEEEVDDLELVAVITAAVAASMGATSTEGLMVRSIRRSAGNKW